MQRKCSHNMPIWLSTKLVNPDLCPRCLINRHIKEIRECQSGINGRGGIFESKQKVLEEREAVGGKKGQQAKRHRAWMRKWRCVKIQVWKDIEMLENILKELDSDYKTELDDIEAECARNFTTTALTLWESEVESLMEMPGVRCVGDKLESDDDTGQPEDSVNDTRANPSAGFNCGTRVPQDIPLPSEQTDQRDGQDRETLPAEVSLPYNGDGEHNRTNPEDIPLPEGDEKDSAYNDLIALSWPNDETNSALAEMEDTATRILQRMDAEDEARLRTSVQRLSFQTPSTPSHPCTPARSIIRHRSSLLSRPFTPHSSSKSIHFADFATIATDAAFSTPSEQPHNVHTSANMKRQSKYFHRAHPNYAPSTWSSPEGCEKVETSWFNECWDIMNKAEEEEEEVEVKHGEKGVEYDADAERNGVDEAREKEEQDAAIDLVNCSRLLEVEHAAQEGVVRALASAPATIAAVTYAEFPLEEKLEAIAGAWILSWWAGTILTLPTTLAYLETQFQTSKSVR